MTSSNENRKGAMIVLVAAVLVILLVGAVFTIDVAYMHMVRAELRTATDAAAQAGSATLARTQDEAQARQAAVSIASLNQVAGRGLTLEPSDIQLGTVRASNSGRLDFVANEVPLTAVRVTGSRTAADPDGSVSLFFARLFSARDFEPSKIATASANVRDVALVLDVSGSMGVRSGSQTRLQALKTAVGIFIDEVESLSGGTLISLTTYSSSPSKQQNLTDNFGAIRSQVAAMRASGATAIGNGLTMGSDSLAFDPLNREFAAKTVIVMTDGQHNTGPSPATTVRTAVARGQTVHTVTFSSGADQALMRSVAEATPGGTHIHADDAADLAEAFREIARSLFVTLTE